MPNPLLSRLTSKPTRLTARGAFWLAFGLGLAGLIFSSLRFLNARASSDGLLFLPIGFLLISALTPPILALLAAIFTARHTQGGAYELLKATNISNAEIVQGSLYAALYRMRALLVVGVGAMPAMVIGMFDLNLRVAIIFCTIMASPYMNDMQRALSNCKLPAPDTGLLWLSITLGLWGCGWLGAALGVALALWRRNTLLAAVVAPLAIIAAMIATFWVWVSLLESGPVATWSISLVWMIAPYASAFALTRLSERWARNQSASADL